MNKETREAVLRRDGKCFKCGRADKLHVHHLKSRAKGGKNDLSNLIALCPFCHIKAELDRKKYGKTKYYRDMVNYAKVIKCNFHIIQDG